MTFLVTKVIVSHGLNIQTVLKQEYTSHCHIAKIPGRKDALNSDSPVFEKHNQLQKDVQQFSIYRPCNSSEGNKALFQQKEIVLEINILTLHDFHQDVPKSQSRNC